MARRMPAPDDWTEHTCTMYCTCVGFMNYVQNVDVDEERKKMGEDKGVEERR